MNVQTKLILSMFRDAPPYYLKKILWDWGVIPTHSGFTRFVIIGRPRTGTNLLRSLLNAHGQAVAFGEMFRYPRFIGWGMDYYPRLGPLRRMMERDPIRFMDQVVFQDHPTRIRAVGFKLFYRHARHGEWAHIWDVLKERKDLVIIHMRRDNMLKTHLSHMKAIQTGVWETKRGATQGDAPMSLDVAQTQAMFETYQADSLAADAWFAEHTLINMTYEGLVRDREGTMNQISDILGIERRQVAPGIRKQSARPLSEAITNYGELQRHFADTPWSRFFTE